MSAAEIIEQIKQLPPEERREVFSLVHEMEKEPVVAESEVSPEFRRLADQVFNRNEELFRKLAQ
jgi:hypothetical protein